MKKKQTAVEWLIERLESGDMYNVEDAQFIKEKAFQMEKEQMFDFTKQFHVIGEATNKFYNHEFEQYYNETYVG